MGLKDLYYLLTSKLIHANMFQCQYCNTWFDQKLRFKQIMDSEPEDDYKKMIMMSGYCSKKCCETDIHLTRSINSIVEQ